jgi:hypothetical protein
LMAARTPADGKRAEASLWELGIRLPQAPTPFGAYVEADVQTGDLLFLGGMLPIAPPRLRYA